MVSFLITLAFVTIIVVAGVIVNMLLYGPNAKRFRRSRGLKPVPGRYTTGEPMSDAEYYTRLVRVHEDGPRYARRSLTMMFIVGIVIIIVVMFLLSGLIH